MIVNNRQLIFFPTLNEESNVVPLIEELRSLYLNSDFLVIDDNSIDNTVVNLSKLKIKNLTILVRDRDLGIGSAHKHALRYALAKNYEILITLDSDGTHRPVDVLAIINQLNAFDLVVGSRFLRNGAIFGWSKSREFLTKSGHLITKLGLGVPYDCSSGMRGYNLLNNSFEDVLNIDGDNFDFFYKSLFAFHLTNPGKIGEVPLTLLPRASGNSKLTIKLAVISIAGLFIDILKFRLVHRTKLN